MNADKVSTFGARLASIGHAPGFLSAFICVHLRLKLLAYWPLHRSPRSRPIGAWRANISRQLWQLY
jgi:hypothetical protein